VKKIKKTIAARVLEKIESYGAQAGVQYLVNRMVQRKSVKIPLVDVPPHIVEVASIQAKEKIKLIIERKLKKQITHDAEVEALFHAVKNHQQEVFIGFDQAVDKLRFYLNLPVDDQELVATAQLKKDAIAFRKNSVSTTKARKVLGCSLTELNRWDDLGYVPHAFKKRIQMQKMVEARFWNMEDLALVDIESLRNRDTTSKKFKRAGLRVAK